MRILVLLTTLVCFATPCFSGDSLVCSASFSDRLTSSFSLIYQKLPENLSFTSVELIIQSPSEVINYSVFPMPKLRDNNDYSKMSLFFSFCRQNFSQLDTKLREDDIEPDDITVLWQFLKMKF